MSSLTNSAYSTFVEGNKEELRKFYPVFNGFQNEEDNVDTVLYTNDLNTSAAIVTGTISALSTGAPTPARKYNNVFAYGYTTGVRPLARRTTGYKRITATGVGSGRNFTGFKVSATLGDSVGIVMKVGATATVTVIVRTSSGNEESFTITGVTTSWDLYTVELGTGTITGTPVYSNITEIQITSSIATTVDVYTIAFANNASAFIGQQITIGFDCIDSQEMETIRELADVMCYNYVERKTPTKTGMTLKLTTNNTNYLLNAAGIGEVIKRGLTNVIKTLNSETEGAKDDVTAGVITLATGLVATRFRHVRIGDITLQRVDRVGDIGQYGYHYNSTTGALTVSTDYNGQFPLVTYMDSVIGEYYELRNLKSGVVGNLSFGVDTADGVQIVNEIFKVQLGKITKSSGDANAKQETELEALPYKRGNDYLFGRFSKL